MPSIKMKIINSKGVCSAGHEVGEEFTLNLRGHNLIWDKNLKICAELLNVVFPAAMTMAYGGELPWENEEGKAKIGCPDPNVQILLELSCLE